MKVLNIRELSDGGAELELELTTEENRILIEYAIRDLLKKYLKEQANGEG